MVGFGLDWVEAFVEYRVGRPGRVELRNVDCGGQTGFAVFFDGVKVYPENASGDTSGFFDTKSDSLVFTSDDDDVFYDWLISGDFDETTIKIDDSLENKVLERVGRKTGNVEFVNVSWDSFLGDGIVDYGFRVLVDQVKVWPVNDGLPGDIYGWCSDGCLHITSVFNSGFFNWLANIPLFHE